MYMEGMVTDMRALLVWKVQYMFSISSALLQLDRVCNNNKKETTRQVAFSTQETKSELRSVLFFL